MAESIGEYSAKKFYSFPTGQKNCEKVSPYFSLSGVEKCPNLHFFGKNCQGIHFFRKNCQDAGSLEKRGKK